MFYTKLCFEIITNTGHNKLVIERNWRMVYLLLLMNGNALMCSMVNIIADDREYRPVFNLLRVTFPASSTTSLLWRSREH